MVNENNHFVKIVSFANPGFSLSGCYSRVDIPGFDRFYHF